MSSTEYLVVRVIISYVVLLFFDDQSGDDHHDDESQHDLSWEVLSLSVVTRICHAFAGKERRNIIHRNQD